MTEANNVYFKELNLEEKQSKLGYLTQKKDSKIIIWQKGESKKFSLSVINYIRSKTELELEGKFDKDLLNKDVLYTFEVSGLNFFGKAKFVSVGEKKFFLVCSDTMFKSERRSNFRLLTYPHHNVFIHINIPEEEAVDSNVISLNTGSSQTGLFNNFLDIVNNENRQEIQPIAGNVKFRVIDISVTGLAFQFSEVEASVLNKIDAIYKNVTLEFNGEILNIPEVEKLYQLDFLARNNKSRMYKAGCRFNNIDINLDESLAKLINTTMRSVESEFEDFV